MRGGDRTGICEYRGEAQGEDGAGSLHAKAGRSVSLCPDRDGEGAAGNGASGAGGILDLSHYLHLRHYTYDTRLNTQDGEGAAANGASGAGGMWRGVWEVWCADAHHAVLLSCI